MIKCVTTVRKNVMQGKADFKLNNIIVKLCKIILPLLCNHTNFKNSFSSWNNFPFMCW